MNSKSNLKLNQPKISIIVPVYNVEKYLSRCLESLIKQTYENIEIIIVNDGSTDRSLLICEDYSNEYTNIKVVTKENGGLSSARNVGLNEATGDFISFIDSDDWVSEDMFEYMIDKFEQNDIDIVDIKILQVNDESINEKIQESTEKYKIFKGNESIYRYLYRGLNEKNGAPFSVCRKLFKRTLFIGDTSCFDEGIVNEDICFNFRIIKKSIGLLESNQIKYFYYQGNQSLTTGALSIRDLDLLKVSEELVHLAEEINEERIIDLANKKKIRSYFSLLARIAVSGANSTVTNLDFLVEKLLLNLKKNIIGLLKSPIPFTRKILAICFCINYKFTCFIIRKIMK